MDGRRRSAASGRCRTFPKEERQARQPEHHEAAPNKNSAVKEAIAEAKRESAERKRSVAEGRKAVQAAIGEAVTAEAPA